MILEDRANTLTHAVGMGICIAGLALMALLSARIGDPWKIVSVCVFGSTLVLLYGTSTLYHSTHSIELRRIFRIIDHISIRLLIAGTYTPFLLVNLRGPWGWSLFWVLWGMALGGIVSDLFFTGKFKLLSTLMYLVMGWAAVVVLGPLIRSLPPTGFALLLAGGLSYSLGSVFYLLDKRIPFGHAVWHLFVLGGSICHFFAVVIGVLPFQR